MELRDYDPWPAVGGAHDFASFMKRSRPEPDDTWKPVLEAFHTHRELVLRFELPGVDPSDIDLRVDQRVLYVRGVRRRVDQAAPELVVRDERSYGPFDRSVALPEGTEASGVRAAYLHGLLEVRVPHVRRPSPVTVPIEIEQLEPLSLDVQQDSGTR